MLNAAWFSLLVFAASLIGGTHLGPARSAGSFQSAQSAGATSRAPLALTTETPATMPPDPTPTPFHNPDPPTGPGGLGSGGDGRESCPTGYQLQADGLCHRYEYYRGRYYIVY